MSTVYWVFTDLHGYRHALTARASATTHFLTGEHTCLGCNNDLVKKDDEDRSPPPFTVYCTICGTQRGTVSRK